MINKIMVSMQMALSDAKTAGVVATGTMGFSLAQIMGWLQANVGLIGAILGIILTAVTIKVQWANGKKAELELELLRRQLEK
ncbi:MAG: hypothetical protein ACRC9V_06025 [Aeromonas sp.]